MIGQLILSQAWQDLAKHAETMKTTSVKRMFDDDENRAMLFTLGVNDFVVDCSKNLMNSTTLALLMKLARQQKVEQWREKMFAGDRINLTEERAVLHTALRAEEAAEVFLDGQDVMPEVIAVRKACYSFAEKVRKGEWKGATGKRINRVVNIGIGGSDLGPKMVVESLAPFVTPDIEFNFVSNIDGADMDRVLVKADAETTLFIVASKTFTTIETLTNAKTARKWLVEKLGNNEAAVANHFVAVSTNRDEVEKFGINADEAMFGFWEWVGGRYSVWSSIGLPVMIAIGVDNFDMFLKGAREMDEHFCANRLEDNIPVVLAMLGIWYRNFLKMPAIAILPYDQRLESLSRYLQQLDMESNGKRVDKEGMFVNYDTGPIVFGEPGTNGQHAFYQLIHQGTTPTPCDFIMARKSYHDLDEHHKILAANYIAQTEALMAGLDESAVRKDLERNSNLPRFSQEKLVRHKIFPGNRPTNSIHFGELTPRNLGRLLAMYEHKVFVQGIVWNINSFDQFGVELGKVLAKTVMQDFDKGESERQHDSSTLALINSFEK